MLARSLSVVLSVLAVGLLALAYTLGWQSPSARNPIDQGDSPSREKAQQHTLCNRLYDQLLGCEESLQARLLEQKTRASRFPTKLRRLLAIKERHALERDALHRCLGADAASPMESDLTHCLGRPSCDDFAACVAEGR